MVLQALGPAFRRKPAGRALARGGLRWQRGLANLDDKAGAWLAGGAKPGILRSADG